MLFTGKQIAIGARMTGRILTGMLKLNADVFKGYGAVNWPTSLVHASAETRMKQGIFADLSNRAHTALLEAARSMPSVRNGFWKSNVPISWVNAGQKSEEDQTGCCEE
jgi:hypothetical protein